MKNTKQNATNGNGNASTFLAQLTRLEILVSETSERAHYAARLRSLNITLTGKAHTPAKVNLLTIQNAKTTKGEALGVLTGILYLAPANESGVINTCPAASEGCRADCLYTAGRGRFAEIKEARIKKTKAYASDPAAFIETLAENITRLAHKAEKLGLKPAVRINGTSDLTGLARTLAKRFPFVQFYDYTKLAKPYARTLPNYHLTFSRSENNAAQVYDALENGINVAVVFDTMRGKPLPETWHGYKVIDGDVHDLRFLDEIQADGRGVIVGLRAKGTAIYNTNGFVVKDARHGRAAIREAKTRAKLSPVDRMRRAGEMLKGRAGRLPSVSRETLAEARAQVI